MELKTRDYDLTTVLRKLHPDEKNDLAKALKYNGFEELKDKYSQEDDDLVLEKEIRYVGSDWIWHGVFGKDWALYGEILRNVAGKLDKNIKYTNNTSIEDLERKIIISILNKAWEKMSEGERQEYEKAISEFEEDMQINDPEKLSKLKEKYKVGSLSGLSPAVLLSAGLAFKMGGFVSYQILAVVMGAISRTLVKKGSRMVVMQMTSKVASMAVPILNIVSAVWLVWDARNWICGPAMRKVVPVVFMIGASRLKQNV